MTPTLKPAAKTVKDTIESRRSIRQFEQTAMSEADLLEILSLTSLAARGLSYDTSVMLGFKPDKVKRLLEIPEHAQVRALIAFGRGTQEGLAHHRLPLEVLARFVR